MSWWSRAFSIRLALVAVLVLAFAAPPALADDDDEEDDEPSAFQEYLSQRRNNLVVGLNGIATAPADPVGLAIDGPDVFTGWWPPVAHTAGFFGGICQSAYRVFMGSVDVALSPFPYIPIVSPVQRHKLLTFEHPDG